MIGETTVITTESHVPSVEERIGIAFAQAGVIGKVSVWGDPPVVIFFSLQEAQQDVMRKLAEKRDSEGGNAVIASHFQHDLETTALDAATMIYAQGTIVGVASSRNSSERLTSVCVPASASRVLVDTNDRFASLVITGPILQ
jgi:hypothetical protein